MNRLPSEVYRYLDEHPRHVAVPHRLMTYPHDVSSLHHAVDQYMMHHPVDEHMMHLTCSSSSAYDAVESGGR